MPDRIALGEPRAELFGPHSWQPPAPRAAATAPRVPTAPPMPYQFAGKLLQDGRLQVFLAKGESVVAIQEGDTLDGGYRVESIGETQVTLIYLPLKQKQSIVVSSWLPPAAAGTSTGAPASSRATLSWRAPDTIKVGEDVKVELLVKTDGALRSLPLQVSFDPGALQFVEVQEGMFFKQGGQQTSFAHNVDQANGRLFVGITRSGADGAKGEDGLLTIVFRAKARIPRSELRVLAATAVSVGPGAVTVGLPQPQVLSVVQ
ncbi:MAG: hypothetical protein A3F84_04550 [Candidatus Handelsmanbacteria bacterium RIFCSPLOWO2_12_FULL_64_10]|uniref:Cohesin domain-containing protein n=1 Tax=Handelsmanbacteria sp. (strain RIFCSPLOWO2_12_FULL_64_10) TaxID=1817868 RepID=A0A1F6D6K4_HANXR|nr:MAG: hypothetical protein A3F84_04550 [Candidatus Handelsmanbacteria bacterium RIFCSPLOWO2_12_FULL_64_10]